MKPRSRARLAFLRRLSCAAGGKGFRTSASAQSGIAPRANGPTINSTTAEASATYGSGDVAVRGSAGWTQRYRHMHHYRAILDEPSTPALPTSPARRFETPEDIVMPDQSERVHEAPNEWSEPSLAVRSARALLVATYNPQPTVSLKARAGLGRGLFHSFAMGNQGTTLAMFDSATQYAHVQSSVGSLSAELSYTWGEQGKAESPALSWSYKQLDADVGYDYTLGALRLRPSPQVRRALYQSSLLEEVFVNARNALLQRQREFPLSDLVGATLLAGCRLQWR